MLIRFGGGGWTWRDVYNMPVYLRDFYIREMVGVIDKEKRQMQEQANNVSKMPHTPPSVR